MKTNFLELKTESVNEFDRIANELLNNYGIENDYSLYRITELEFYWHSVKHPDPTTYKRIHTDPNTGEWFFHYSGVDIALKSTEFGGVGGILIRRIYCLNENKQYKGPMVCAMKLFSGTSVFSDSIKTKIIKHQFESKEIKKTPRVGIGKNGIDSGTDLLEYRYLIKV